MHDGPSDTSDSGSDMAGQRLVDDDRLNLDRGSRQGADVRPNRDRGFDRIVGPSEAALGGGMDQAEEARAGTTDEEIEREARLRKPKP